MHLQKYKKASRDSQYSQLGVGFCKTWTLNSGLDRGLYCGVDSSDYGCVRFSISVAYSSRTAIDFTVIFHVQSHYRARFVPVSECHS